ncbi:micronuclear linker histone polyprotein-like [Heterodontus francisci]|uniref:micronuclear linker histone polyprotein-like n=1 Tax=Heterodontus francisci TaxID=7792 RepID=UPI00355B5747
MSSLSYRKRGNMKDSLGGKSNNDSLLSTLSKERSVSPDRSFRRTKKTTSTDNVNDSFSVISWKKSQGADDLDDRGSVISQTYSEATSRARKGLDRRWALASPDFDKASTVSVPVSRVSTRRGLEADDDAKSSVSFAITSPPSSLRRSLSRLDDNHSDLFSPVSPSLSRRSELGLQSPTLSSRTDSRLSFSGSRLGELDDHAPISIALSERSSYSQHSVGRSFSVPPRPRSSVSDDMQPNSSDIKPVGHRNYLDPDLEAAINEVLNYKPITFKRKSLDPDSEGDEEEVNKQPSNLRRASCSLDFSMLQSKRNKSKPSKNSASESSDFEKEQRKKGSKKHSKKSKKKSKKKESSSESSESSSSSSSSGSTVSYCSINSVKRGTKKREPNSEDEGGKESKTDEKSGRKTKKSNKKMKQVDSVMMKYLYRPESD